MFYFRECNPGHVRHRAAPTDILCDRSPGQFVSVPRMRGNRTLELTVAAAATLRVVWAGPA